MPKVTGFQLIESVGTEVAKKLPISSIAVTKGDLLARAVGATTWTAATSSTLASQRKAVALETVTSSATEVLCMEVLPGQKWAAETANNSAAADNGDRMVLTDTNTVNNTGTDSAAKEAVFIQEDVLGDAADKTIVGEIVYGAGVTYSAS